jgi:hypothetical protein
MKLEQELHDQILPLVPLRSASLKKSNARSENSCWLIGSIANG